MALSSSCSYSIGFGGISCPRVNPRKARHCLRHGQLGLVFSAEPEELETLVASHFGGFNIESPIRCLAKRVLQFSNSNSL